MKPYWGTGYRIELRSGYQILDIFSYFVLTLFLSTIVVNHFHYFSNNFSTTFSNHSNGLQLKKCLTFPNLFLVKFNIFSLINSEECSFSYCPFLSEKKNLRNMYLAVSGVFSYLTARSWGAHHYPSLVRLYICISFLVRLS